MFSSRTLKNKFSVMRQRPGEAIRSWACRTETAVGEIMKVDPTEDEDDLKRTQFFYGLANEKVQTGIRHLYDSGKTADFLLKKARTIEGEKPESEEPEPPAAVIKQKAQKSSVSPHQSASVAQQPVCEPASQQYITVSAEDFKQLLDQVNQVCTRLTALEKVVKSGGQSHKSKASQPSSGAVDTGAVDNTMSRRPGGSKKSSSTDGNVRPFCERCRRTNHTIRKCIAKFDVDGNPLNG